MTSSSVRWLYEISDVLVACSLSFDNELEVEECHKVDNREHLESLSKKKARCVKLGSYDVAKLRKRA
jgi:hypothetical protein